MTDTRYTNAGTREEWVRADTIPAAQIAEARREALREAEARVDGMRLQNLDVTKPHPYNDAIDDASEAILALIDAPAPAPAQPSVQEAAQEACKIIDEVVREGHTNLGDMVLHFMTAVEPARRALRAAEDQT